MCRQSEFQLNYFKLWISCFDDDDEEEIGSPNLHTHLAFDFHGVAISAPERLRLVKTPIHFPGCSFCTTPPKKSSARLCPQKVGLWFLMSRSDKIRPIRLRTLRTSGFGDFISRSGLIWVFPRCVSVR